MDLSGPAAQLSGCSSLDIANMKAIICVTRHSVDTTTAKPGPVLATITAKRPVATKHASSIQERDSEASSKVAPNERTQTDMRRCARVAFGFGSRARPQPQVPPSADRRVEEPIQPPGRGPEPAEHCKCDPNKECGTPDGAVVQQGKRP